ncbi:ABC transporter ATP-binding protein [Acuticoccus sp. MNP-M23]|uniref:ABC transporter ATP-binding protein n=1 Tax=Acuticoccus sp. MNP-M23 TaxID=3072793 RepID=UPI0028159F00|nr:ABC transporter ATP-binding protein [Acuticoccus sp. MNP-M23]WMS42562.1 ABC transporter ATP-binding protein [Acuticoccus sp. MNP-M23]
MIETTRVTHPNDGKRENFCDAGPEGRPAGISLRGLTKRFGKTAAVDNVTLDIADGEFFVVLGPSGCGKSTLLRLIAGLETADSGTISLAGAPVAGDGHSVPPEGRSVAVVFQSYALWPHMSVRKNVAFPVESGNFSRKDAAAIVDGALKAVALEPFAERKPAGLSGGQQQRVALARCLASRASTVLMDEPLANLDVHLRATMEDELARVHAASGATTLYITHDQREAMALATRVAVMQSGRILQVAAPQALYERPASEPVARFIGRSTIVDATLRDVNGTMATADAGGATWPVACEAGTSAGPARVVIRPHHVVFSQDGPLSGTVQRTAYRGGMFEMYVDTGTFSIAAETRQPPGDGPVRLGFAGGWALPPG